MKTEYKLCWDRVSYCVHHLLLRGTRCNLMCSSSCNKPLFVKNTFHRFDDAILTYNKEFVLSRTSIGSTKCKHVYYGQIHHELRDACMYTRFPLRMLFTSNLGGVASWKGGTQTFLYFRAYITLPIQYRIRLCITTLPGTTFGVLSNSSPGVLYPRGVI